MFTKTAVTETGDVIVNIVKAPVTTFDIDYQLWNTEAHRTGMILRRNYATCRERCVFSGSVGHHDEFIVPNETEPYQGALTRAEVRNADRINLYGISDFSRAHKSLIAEIHEGQTQLLAPVYDRYLVDCAAVPEGIGELSLYSDLAIAYSGLGSIITRGYSSIDLNKIHRIGSVFALTFEPSETRIRFAVSFDGHKTYWRFHRRKLVPISDNPEEIIAEGNDRNDLCYGMRNMIPSPEQKKVDFKIVLQSDNPNATPVFYGFKCSLYSKISRNSCEN